MSAAGYIATIGNGSTGDFNGSIADVSLYTSQLTPDQVTGALRRAAPSRSRATTTGNAVPPPR